MTFNWYAIIAVFTSIGVLIALFKLSVDQYVKNKKILSAIEYEFELVKNMLSPLINKDFFKFEGNKIFEYSETDVLLKIITHPILDTYKADFILIEK